MATFDRMRKARKKTPTPKPVHESEGSVTLNFEIDGDSILSATLRTKQQTVAAMIPVLTTFLKGYVQGRQGSVPGTRSTLAATARKFATTLDSTQLGKIVDAGILTPEQMVSLMELLNHAELQG